jgi:phosphoribosylanthranilate isomerase
MIVHSERDGVAPPSKTRVKICGLTRPEDAASAVELGADAVGVVFAASPRQVEVAQAVRVLENVPSYVQRVGVFADQPAELIREAVQMCRLDWVQLSGDESPELASSIDAPIMKAIHVRDAGDVEMRRGYPADAFLLDAPPIDGQMGGTGSAFDWSKAEDLPWPLRQVVVAGGLDAGNVGLAIERLRPGGVDVSSGVESSPGVKDAEKIEAFVLAVREADRRLRLRNP